MKDDIRDAICAIEECSVEELDAILRAARVRKKELTTQILVPTKTSDFGVWLDIQGRLPEATSIAIAVIVAGGRRFLHYVMLPHQLYLKKVQGIIDEHNPQIIEVYGIDKKNLIQVWRKPNANPK